MTKVWVICLVLGLFAAPAYSTFGADDVTYMLYTRDHSATPYEVFLGFSQKYADEGLVRKGPHQLVKILCHGYVDNSSAIWIAPTKEAYMAQNIDYVIAVDWGKHSYGNYDTVRGKTPDVGEHISKMVIEMSTNFEIPLYNFHLVGHSLGSHISGFAGKRIFEATGKKLGRITGLDPAGPGFNTATGEHRLTSEDAQFVDAIHTDTSIMGYKKSIAHADFWPNGGSGQIGCGFLQISCSHNRAPAYFHEGIGNKNFPAWKCASQKSFNSKKCFENEMAIMGDGCENSASGDYYLNTNKQSPFGIPSY